MKVLKTLLIFAVFGALFLFNPSPGLAGPSIDPDSPGDSAYCVESCNKERKEDCARSECSSCFFCYNVWQTANPLKQFQEIVINDRETGQLHFESFSHNAIGNTLNSGTTYLMGEIDWEAMEEAIKNRNPQALHRGGALGAATQLLSNVLIPPQASSVEYLADLGTSLGIAKPAYAQGIGFRQLSKLLPIWKAFRNLAYILFVVVFIALGLAIMFRVKLDPKTVITVQNAIPKLIIALILVTFSYAIAGLFIDLIYLLIFLGVLALSGVPGLTGTTGVNPVLETQQIFSSLSFGEAVGKVITTGIGSSLKALTGDALGGIVIFVILEAALAIASAHLAALLPLTILIIAFFLILKLFFRLIGIYISIILLIIFAPLIILMGALPGSKMGFGSWINDLLKKILVFPAVALLILLAQLLSKQTGPDWVPPVLGTEGGGMLAIISLGMLLMLNKIPDAIEAAFAGKPFPYGTAIGENVAPGRQLIGSRIGKLADDLETSGKIAYEAAKIARPNDPAYWFEEQQRHSRGAGAVRWIQGFVSGGKK